MERAMMKIESPKASSDGRIRRGAVWPAYLTILLAVGFVGYAYSSRGSDQFANRASVVATFFAVPFAILFVVWCVAFWRDWKKGVYDKKPDDYGWGFLSLFIAIALGVVAFVAIFAAAVFGIVAYSASIVANDLL